MSDAFDIVFVRVWWAWPETSRQLFDWVYHWFNIIEGCAWLVFAGLVLRRAMTHSRSGLEFAYALAFCVFAVTDFREALEQSSWLIWLKLINLIALFWLRRSVMLRWYPEAKLY